MRGSDVSVAAVLGALVGASLALAVVLTLTNREALQAAPTAQPFPLMRLVPDAPRYPDFVVGEGVAARMRELRDAPASDELYLGRGVSVTVSVRGAVYIYSRENNRTEVFAPADRAP